MLEMLNLRDNDLDCLSTEEMSYMRMLRTVRIDGNPWLCNCRERIDKYLQDRSIVQERECSRDIYFCKKHQCMMQIEFSTLSPPFTTQHFNDFNRERAMTHRNEFETNVFTSLDRLPDKTTWIEIYGLTIETIPRYAFFRFGNSLQSLSLNNCRIERIEENAFAGLHRLQRLSLIGNGFLIVGANWFRDLVNLQQLILRNNDIEQIERTALSYVGDSLRYLDIRNNRLRCLATEELATLRMLERLDAIGNPWLCICRSRLQSFLTHKNIGFEINAGRCYENEIEIANSDTNQQQQQITTETAPVMTGRVHWTSFEDSIRESNITIARPSSSTRVTEVPIVALQPPIYNGSCYPEKAITPSTYICRAITSIEELNIIPSVTHTVHISLSNIKKIPKNTFTRFNGYLSKLEFHDCGIEKIEPYAFSGLYNLQHLSLRNNQLEFIDAEMIQGISSLRYLDISKNNIIGIANNVFDELPYLKQLDLSENSINCIGVEYMAQRLRYLTSLKVVDNPWSCLCAAKLAEFLNTREIYYDRHSLLSKEYCYATQIASITTPVPVTSPTSSPVWNETIEGICNRYEDNTEIRYRCTGGNLLLLQSIPAEVTAIEFLQGHLPRLSAESFSKFKNLYELIITNSGLTTIEQGALNGLHKLQNLTIQDNPLEMIGSSWFVLKNLERLDLRGNSIKYISPNAFKHLDQLMYLNLEGNDLKCIFTSDLNNMPNLYVVEFSGNPLKWRCRVDLEQFLEARQIRYVKIENPCEGKKLMRNLQLENKTDGSFDCPSECSSASYIDQNFLFFIYTLLLITWIY
ncbi:uncharacterized protein LOC143178097 isoform X2 [Calliopsis andreniformis]